jgi:diguanylate cyclase (GGDEF)-like protein
MHGKGKKHNGLSLRTVNTVIIVCAIVVSAVVFLATIKLSESFKRVTESSEEHIRLRKAAIELMDASDFLTEKVQRFSVTGDTHFLLEYFEEALIANHREEALTKMSAGTASEEAVNDLKEAMDGSLHLMSTEYYAMKLVIEALGIREYPAVLKPVELSEKDKALSSEEKMSLAALMVHDDEYYRQKTLIRNNMKASLDELEKMAFDEDAASLQNLSRELGIVRLIIILQTVSIVAMVVLTTILGIHPVLNAVDRIKEDSPIPEGGAAEFRYLAKAYNKLYSAYKKSLEKLSFKASHDELTGVYNRAGYDLLVSSVDLHDTYMLLFDVDNFKTINDTQGHTVGDEAIKKVARVLKDNFRGDDYVCRIGGDEFVVLMNHAPKKVSSLIAHKVKQINRDLAAADSDVPAYSVSVGIAHGSDANNVENLFAKCDNALYESKSRGKHTYTFADPV